MSVVLKRENNGKIMPNCSRVLSVLTLLSVFVPALLSCGNSEGYHDHSAHSKNSHSKSEEHSERTRPANQVAVLTVWAEADKFRKTAAFYKDVLGLRTVGHTADQAILDTDGSFIVIMQGKIVHSGNQKRRWPLFALTVPDIDKSIETLKKAKVELPWGVETYGTPEPSSRYVMFRDPAGNLIELVQWL